MVIVSLSLAGLLADWLARLDRARSAVHEERLTDMILESKLAGEKADQERRGGDCF